MNYPQASRLIRTKTTTPSQPSIRFIRMPLPKRSGQDATHSHRPAFSMPVSLAAHPTLCIFRRHQVGFGTEHLKITLVSVDTRASACDQIRGAIPLSMHVTKERFRCPKPSVSCIRPNICRFFSCGCVKKVRGGNLKRSKLVFLRNPANSKGIAEARPEHQNKSICCSTLISGRLSIRPKGPPKPSLE
jgi:hypothetical protein